jgi:hypothetical protein
MSAMALIITTSAALAIWFSVAFYEMSRNH